MKSSKTFVLVAVSCLTFLQPIATGTRTVQFLNKCTNSVRVNYVSVLGTTTQPGKVLCGSNTDCSVPASQSITYNVPDGINTVQFWFESPKDGVNGYARPCPRDTGCLNMQGTRASISFKQLVTTYQVMADAGPCPFTYPITITPAGRDSNCYLSAYALATSASGNCPNVYSGTGTLLQPEKLCPTTYSYTVELCSLNVPDQSRPGTATTPTPTQPSSTSAPLSSTSAPASSTTSPGSSTSAPASSTTSPGSSTSAPASSTTSPGSSTSALASTTSAPASSTSAPASSTSAPLRQGRYIDFVNNCGPEYGSAVKVKYHITLGQNSAQYDGTVGPNSDGSVSPGNTITYNVPDDQSNIAFWFEVSKNGNNYPKPCPNPTGCLRMRGTLAEFAFPALNSVGVSGSYQVTAKDPNDCRFTYPMTISPAPKVHTCYKSSYALATSGAAGSVCPNIYSGDGTLVLNAFQCPKTTSYTVELCSVTAPDQTQPPEVDNTVEPPKLLPRDPTTKSRYIKVVNNCEEKIWVRATNNDDPIITEFLDYNLVPLDSGESYEIGIPNTPWGGRFYAKGRCFRGGYNCKIGEFVEPCPEKGCSPPAAVWSEFFFPHIRDFSDVVWYDMSAVDGFNIYTSLLEPLEPRFDLGPVGKHYGCYPTGFGLTPKDNCPPEPDFFQDKSMRSVNLLSYDKTQCIAPCKVTTADITNPYIQGLGIKDETKQPAFDYCCPQTKFPNSDKVNPDPAVTKSSIECRKGMIKNTAYFNNLKTSRFKSTYSFSYDDDDGLFTCPTVSNFVITYCPDPIHFNELRLPNGQLANPVK